ncbi:MAG: GFA family protein [Bradyrhizobium sp.]
MKASGLQRYRPRQTPDKLEETTGNVTGGCHCGEIRYEVTGEPVVHALCHCTDCRRHAGAPLVGWVMVAEDALKVTRGEPRVYRSSEHGRRQQRR